MKHVFNFFILTALVMSGCNQAIPETKTSGATKDEALLAPGSVEMKKIVEERNLIYDKAMIEGDSINLVNHFTTDCVVLPPNEEQIIGKNAIIPAVMQFSRMGIKKFTDETTRVLGGGEYIIEEGNYFLGGDKDKMLDKGKYLCVWKKENGEWRVCSNMWNTSLPPAPEKK